MTPADSGSFFATVLSAGAILAGFCGTFLTFRIQREATYYRQPVVDFDQEKGKDVFIGLTHFTSAFLLIVLATLFSVVFGFLIPLLAVGGSAWAGGLPGLVVGGILAALVLLGAYFVDELVHYRILSTRLANDASEWRSEWWIVGAGVVGAIACVGYFGLR
jgi:hypothetical protein